MLCGSWATMPSHLPYIDQVICRRESVGDHAGMNGLMLPGRQVYLGDTHANAGPDAAQLAEITVLTAENMNVWVWRPRRRCCRTPASAPAAIPRQ
jgi:malate dehydrogenase (oxaloacetate-decarboxylating)(NADP+)